jgi:dienelactone hydrolase
VFVDYIGRRMQNNCAHVSQATVITYPNARHGFDMRGLPERADLPSGSPAYNAEAAKASWSAAMDFLK